MADEVTEVTEEKRWWASFFDGLSESGIVSAACQKARISRKTVYQYKRENEEFARRWAEAEQLGLSVLEDVAAKRAIKSSDTLLIFLLKHRKKDVYGDQPQDINLRVGTMALDDCDEDELKRRLARASKALLPDGPDSVREG